MDLTRHGTAVSAIKQLLGSLPSIDKVSSEQRRRFERLAGEARRNEGGMTLKDLISDRAKRTWRSRGPAAAGPRIIYSPNTRCVEWFEVPMRAIEDSPHGGIRGYRTPPMVLTIEQPGELCEEPSLHGTITARIDGALLSGAEARLFGATGRRRAKTLPPPT